MTERNLSLSQWYTPTALAERVVSWALQGCEKTLSILEPSAGRGALLEPIPVQYSVRAIEIDPENVMHIEKKFPHVTVLCVDFLNHLSYGKVFDLCIANPPYENGLDAAFVERVIVDGVARRGVFILRAVFLNGSDRWRRVLRHVDIRRLAYLINRPRFGGSSSPRHDFIVAEFVRRDSPRALGEPCAPLVEWWKI